MDIQYLYSFLLALILSLVLIPLLRKYSAHMGLVDHAGGNQRKLHSDSMPRSGGLGIITAAAIALLLVLPVDGYLLGFLFSCFLMIGMMNFLQNAQCSLKDALETIWMRRALLLQEDWLPII